MSGLLDRIMDGRQEFVRLRTLIQRHLADDIRKAEAAGWNEEDTQQIRIDVRRLTTLAGKVSVALAIAAFVPLVVVVGFLATHERGQPLGFVYPVFSVWILLVAVLAMWNLWPLVGILRLLRAMPDSSYRELIQPVRQNIDLGNVLISITLMLYVFLSMEIGKAYPIFVILAVLWLVVPMGAYVGGRDSLFIGLRVAQLGILFVAALFSVLSPVPIKHYQLWAQKEAATKLRPVEQKEITSDWKEIQWFTQEGVPLVWFVLRSDGYHLFNTPGHDPETNEELRQVINKVTRERIVASLRTRTGIREAESKAESERKADEERTAAEKTARARVVSAEAARVERERAVVREKSETAARLLSAYVSPEFTKGNKGKAGTSVVVLDERNQENATLSVRLSRALNGSGFGTVVGVFRSAFFSSEDFARLISGQIEAEPRFRASDYLDRLLVVQISTRLVEGNIQTDKELVSAETAWKIRLISTGSGRLQYEGEIRERGIGFKQPVASANAIERAESQFLRIVTKEIGQ